MFDLLSTAELTAGSAIVVFVLSSMLSSTARQRGWIAAALALWFCLTVAAGATGALARPIGPGIPAVPFGVLIPLAALSLPVLGTARGRDRVRRVPMTTLVGLHMVRVLGITFVLLYWAKRLPAPFAPVAGWGDVLVGLLAIPLVLGMRRGASTIPRGRIAMWNVLGVADLVTALTLGATSTPGPIQLFHGEPSAAIMTGLPWVLIPCFLVPSLFFVHLCIVYQLQALGSNEGNASLPPIGAATPSA